MRLTRNTHMHVTVTWEVIMTLQEVVHVAQWLNYTLITIKWDF
jgi:hypothetical protein